MGVSDDPADIVGETHENEALNDFENGERNGQQLRLRHNVRHDREQANYVDGREETKGNNGDNRGQAAGAVVHEREEEMHAD